MFKRSKIINKVKKLSKVSDNFKTVVTGLAIVGLLFGFGASVGSLETKVDYNSVKIEQTVQMVEDLREDVVPRRELDAVFERFDSALTRLEKNIDKMESK